MKWLCLVAVLLALQAAFIDAKKRKRAGEIVLDPTSQKLTVTPKQIEDFLKNLPKTTEDKKYWSWTTLTNCLRWGIKGIDQGEMDYLTRPDGDAGQVAGAGVYMASQTTSSQYYGFCPVVFTIPQGTPLYKDDIAKKAFGAVPSQRAKVELGKKAPFLHCDYSELSTKSGWCVTHHRDLVRRTYEADTAARGVAWDLKRKIPDYKTLSKVLLQEFKSTDLAQLSGLPKYKTFTDGLGYLTSFSALMYYMDGFSLIRAAQVRPENPWGEFDPDHFEMYKVAREKYELKALKGESIGLSKDGIFGDGVSDAATWAKKVVEQVLPTLYHDLSGQDIKFRTSEVRAGGDEQGKMFATTSQQILEMKKNPYLLVGGTFEKPNYFAYYYYPDAKHYSKLVGKKTYLSPAMELKLKDPKLQSGPLTQELITDLITNMLKRIHGKPVDYDTPTGFGLRAILDLVGIHPCTDFNGRTTRFFGQVASLESGKDPAGAFMSDFDLVTDPDIYGKFLAKSTALYHDLRLAMLEEFMKKVLWDNVKADGANSYYALPEFRGLVKSLEVFLGRGKADPSKLGTDQKTMQDIEKRRFVLLLDTLAGKPDWISRNALVPPKIITDNGMAVAGKAVLAAVRLGKPAAIFGIPSDPKGSSKVSKPVSGPK